MPHVSGHNPGSSGIPKSLRPRVRPKTVPGPAFPKNDNPVARQGGGGGPKGGGPARIDPTTEVGQSFVQKYNTDGRYGYYNTNPNHEKYALGEYVPAFRDMMDGGGYDTNDTFFKGAGPISALLNVAKIRPYGQSETPREQIGFRDFTDMTDRGGPQHSGGEFEGGGMISMAGNLMDKLSGREATPKTRYYEGPQSVGLMKTQPVASATVVNTNPNPQELSMVPFNNVTPLTQYNTADMMTSPDELTIPMMNNMSAAAVDTIGVSETPQQRLERFNRLMLTVPDDVSVDDHSRYMDYILEQNGTLPYAEYSR
tara:strand:+ start:4876 stop:5811 length:936 start_codon:yes stop_codon:yes gene_type:complete